LHSCSIIDIPHRNSYKALLKSCSVPVLQVFPTKEFVNDIEELDSQDTHTLQCVKELVVCKYQYGSFRLKCYQKTKVWDYVCKFQNLHTLITDQELIQFDEESFMSCLKTVQISHLIILNINHQQYSIICEVFQWKKKVESSDFLQKFTLQFPEYEEQKNVLSPLLSCIEKKLLLEFSAVCPCWQWSVMMHKQMIDDSVFSVVHDICGTKDDDCEYFKIRYSSYHEIMHRFTVRLL